MYLQKQYIKYILLQNKNCFIYFIIIILYYYLFNLWIFFINDLQSSIWFMALL